MAVKVRKVLVRYEISDHPLFKALVGLFPTPCGVSKLTETLDDVTDTWATLTVISDTVGSHIAQSGDTTSQHDGTNPLQDHTQAVNVRGGRGFILFRQFRGVAGISPEVVWIVQITFAEVRLGLGRIKQSEAVVGYQWSERTSALLATTWRMRKSMIK